GATGQLGSDLVRTFDGSGELTPLSSRDLDILDAAPTRSALEALRPTCVINTAGYNLVDRAEDDGRSAFALNADPVGSLAPSYTLDLARKVWAVLPKTVHPIYHLTNAGQTSWYDFARRALDLARVTADLTAVSAAEYGSKARRPAYSVLAHGHLAVLGEDDLRPWDAALAAYVAGR